MPIGSAQNSLAAATQALNSPGTISGSSNGSPREKDRTEAQTAPQFGEVMKRIQAQYGAKPEKPREIKKTLGKDDFLRIMITQMKNQDPTNPFKAEQMAAQMAQFTTVEQLKNMNDSLVKMSTGNKPIEHMAMTNMIGKVVTIDRGRFPHTEGQNDELSYGLPKEAAHVKISIISEQGETVFEKELGKTKAGEQTFTWDGKKANSLPAKAGTYMIQVDAEDAQGARIDTSSKGQARVIGVSFEGSEPVFVVGDNKHQEKVTMKNIVRIEDAGAVPSGTSASGGISSAAASSGPAFFTFQKGVGSQALDPSHASEEAQKALAGYLSHQQGAQQAPARAVASAQGAQAPVEKGFPNGLHDN